MLNYALKPEETLLTIAVMKFSESSQEHCFLGCLPTNICK